MLIQFGVKILVSNFYVEILGHTDDGDRIKTKPEPKKKSERIHGDLTFGMVNQHSN